MVYHFVVLSDEVDDFRREINIDAEAAKKWLATGAQPTETAKALLKKAGIIE